MSDDTDEIEYIDPHDLTPDQLKAIRILAFEVYKELKCDYIRAIMIAYFCWLEMGEKEGESTH